MQAIIRKICLVLAIAWMTVIFFLSNQSVLPTPDLFSFQDKVIHAIVYGLLGVLLLMSLKYHAPAYTRWQITTAIALASLYGISDEIHQTFVPGRDGNVADWLADTLGAVVAVLILAQLVKKRLVPAIIWPRSANGIKD